MFLFDHFFWKHLIFHYIFFSFHFLTYFSFIVLSFRSTFIRDFFTTIFYPLLFYLNFIKTIDNYYFHYFWDAFSYILFPTLYHSFSLFQLHTIPTFSFSFSFLITYLLFCPLFFMFFFLFLYFASLICFFFSFFLLSSFIIVKLAIVRSINLLLNRTFVSSHTSNVSLGLNCPFHHF